MAILTLLGLMLSNSEVLSYVWCLPPPNYKLGTVADIVPAYLKKMRETGDKRIKLMRSLYQRVEELQEASSLELDRDKEQETL